VQLADPAARGRAVALVLGGLTVSLVLGVPLGALLGDLGTWRWTLAFVALVAAICAVGLRLLVPHVAATPTSSLGDRLRLLGQAKVVANLGATFLWITGGFVLYTFITAVLTAATGWHGGAVSALLLVYGVAAVAGNAAGGRLADTWGARRTIVTALVSLTVSMSALGWAAQLGPPVGRLLAIVTVIAWPLAGWALTPAQSHRLVRLAPTAGPEVLSLNTSAVYLGIAAGAALGGLVLRHAGVAWLGPTAGALQVLALLAVRGVRSERSAVRLPLPGTANVDVASP
jgi:predicted MFS family arabinose efflux permease